MFFERTNGKSQMTSYTFIASLAVAVLVALAAVRTFAEQAVSPPIAGTRPFAVSFLIYTPPAITNERLVTDTYPPSRYLGGELTCSACRGEYESVTAVVYALKPLEGLLVTTSDLKGPAGTVPAGAVDIRTVKCWYQAGKSVTAAHYPHNMLVPELLLKDDRLVRVDQQKQQNYLRSTAEDGSETYLQCSCAGSEDLKNVRPIDAQELQPVDVPAKSFKQFWINIHVPDDAKTGTYNGTVIFTTKTESLSLPLRVTVHPFDLQPSRLIYSIYYRAKLSEDDKPTIGSEYKSELQYRTEMRDLKAHGVLFPSNYQPAFEDIVFPNDAYYYLDEYVKDWDVALQCVPEPATLALLLIGGFVLLGTKRS